MGGVSDLIADKASPNVSDNNEKLREMRTRMNEVMKNVPAMGEGRGCKLRAARGLGRQGKGGQHGVLVMA